MDEDGGAARDLMAHGARDLGVREVTVVSVGSALLAVVMTWPLVLRLGTHVVPDDGDPLLQAWQVAWGGHALRTDPTGIFQGNTFWPLSDSLAFTDALLGYAPAGLIGSGLTAATVRQALLMLFASALAGVGAHLLARELGARPLPAAIAGVVFAWAPWRLSHVGHLNVLSTGGIALTFFLLARGYRQRRWGLVLSGWLVATWQLSLGLAAGLFFAYALAVVSLVVLVWWWRSGRPLPGRAVLVATGAGVVVLLVATALQALPYLRVLEQHPEAVRTVGYLDIYSPPPLGLLTPPEGNLVWGGLTDGLRADMVWSTEQARFPGAVALLLGLYGAVRAPGRRALRTCLVIAVVVTVVLALGTSIAGGRFTYLPLYEHAPGWQAIRTPGRLITLTTLAIGLLAALGADHLLGDRAAPARRWRLVAVSSLLALAALEGAGEIPLADVPRPASEAAVMAADAPRLHLPSSILRDQDYMLWSTIDGLPPVVNGVAGFEPRFLADLRSEVEDFPSAESLAVLRAVGVRSVVLHPDRAAGTPWEGAESRPTAGLLVSRRSVGGTFVYDLDP